MAGLFLSAESSRKAFPGGSIIYTHDMEKCIFLKIVRYVGSVSDHGHKVVHETKPLFRWSLDSYERGRLGSEGGQLLVIADEKC